MNVGLIGGVVYLSLNMGDGEEREEIGQGRYFDDGYWHEIYIERKALKVQRMLINGIDQ